MTVAHDPAGPSSTGEGLRILVVEDDPTSQDLIRGLCERRGDTVDLAADGFLGLRLLSERRHALVLIDYHLPEMDGYALARLMREIARPEDRTRFVGVTADRHGLALRRGADTLFDAILAKPFEPGALYALLDRLSAPPEEAPEAASPADLVWRRHGLAGRPRAVLCDGPGEAERAAVAEVFALTADPAEAELVLVGREEDRPALRELRGAGEGRLLPAIDLSGRLGAVCDLGFAVGQAASWAAVAEVVQSFGERRRALHPAIRAARDPAARLLGRLFVCGRPLDAEPGPEAALDETGLPRPLLDGAVSALVAVNALAPDPAPDAEGLRLTEIGRRWAVSGEAPLCERASPSPPVRLLDERKVAELARLIGTAELDRLRRQLVREIEPLFREVEAGADAARVHLLIGAAGNLGFDRLSASCRALEAALREGGGAADALAQARNAALASLAACGLERASGALRRPA